MEPRLFHSGGSVSAKSGAEPAALISARGTSVCARRRNMFGEPPATGERQTGISGAENGSDVSEAAKPASARGTMLLVISAANAVPARAAALAETSSLCDRVDVAMSYSLGRRPNLGCQCTEPWIGEANF